MINLVKISGLACSVCFKDPSSNQTLGLKSAVLVMLAALSIVLIALVKFFFSLRKRSLNMS